MNCLLNIKEYSANRYNIYLCVNVAAGFLSFLALRFLILEWGVGTRAAGNGFVCCFLLILRILLVEPAALIPFRCKLHRFFIGGTKNVLDIR